MIRVHFQYVPCLVLVLFLLLSGACVKRQNIHQSNEVTEKQQSVTMSSSLKTSDGKVIIGRDQVPVAMGETENKSGQGKCVYGCTEKPLADKKNEEKTASLKGEMASLDSSVKDISPDYILGTEDIIDVSVWKNENLSRTVLIRPDGKISLPLIGDVQAAGLTTSQLRDSIKAKLKEYKETPEVSIIVKEINSFVVFVTGEVTHPGKLMLKSDTSLLQAISLAGGFTQYASKNSIVLLRRAGRVETRKIIRYKDIVSGKKPEDDILLQRGDTIVVP